MSVNVRLQRHGSKKRPFYQLVAADRRNPRDGKYIEKLGYYDPAKEPSTFEFKEDRVRHWFNCGAQLSPTVEKLLKRNNFSMIRTKQS